MKNLKTKILIGIIATAFLFIGCAAKPVAFGIGWNPDRIKTAILAARVVETRANIRADTEGSEAKAYVQKGLALMLNDGLLLTLKHLVEVPTTKTVRGGPYGMTFVIPLVATDIGSFLDGEEIDLIGTFDDVAVFNTHKPTSQQVKFGNSDAARAGDLVLLIGRSFGLDLNLKMGIISNLNASQYGGEILDLSNCFLLDVSTNFGDSGGMVLNSAFEIIGIANATGPGAGLAFAIKINEVKDYILRILKPYKYHKET